MSAQKENKKDNQSKLIRAVFLSSVGMMIFSNLATFAGSMVDGILTAKFLGLEYMAAFQVSAPFMLLMVMVSQIFSVGVQGVCAKLVGGGKDREATSTYTTSLIILAVISVIVMIATIFAAAPIATALGASGKKAELLPEVTGYIRGVSIGTPALCLMPMLIAVMFIEGRGKLVVAAVGIQTVVDVVLDLANIFGFKKGMLGMGIATSVCYYAAFAYVLFMRLRHPGTIRLHPKSFSLKTLPGVVRIGVPAAVDRAYKTIQMYVLNHVLAAVAVSAALAAFGSVNTLNNLFNPVTNGIATSVMTMAAVFYGERDKGSIHRMMKFAVIVTIVIELLVAALSWIAAPGLMWIFAKSTEPEALSISVRALRIFVLYLPFYGLNHIFQKYYNGVGNVKMTYILSAFDNLIFICLFGVVLGNLFGSDGVFIAFLIAEICTTFAMWIVVSMMNHRPVRKVEDFLDLPKDFDIVESTEYSASARTAEEVLRISEQIHAFCKEKGFSERNAMWTSLAVEEMGMNIVRWGMEKKRSASMDIRLFSPEQDRWTLRIRDNAASFDPTKWEEIHRNEDPAKNIGIHLVLSGASNVMYVNALKINNLSISYDAM